MRNKQTNPTGDKGTVDTVEILKFLSLLAEPGQVIELRLLEVQSRERYSPVTMSGYFTNFELLAKCASMHGPFAKGVYITLNPVNPALFARAANRIRVCGKGSPLTSDVDVVTRRWLPIDLDPVRLSGISSTDEEHESAIARAFELRTALRADGFPDPIVADSGNGGHLLYRIDVVASDDGLIKRFLTALSLRFDDERVTVDQTVYNPARIWKLYGTFSRKGDSVPERPHRRARILEVP